MKTTVAFMMAAGALLVIAGCGTTTEKGGPGAKAANQSAEAAKNAKEKLFDMTLPDTTSIKQNSRETATIKLNRGSEFKQPVRLSFTPPAGLKVKPDDAGFKEGETETTITIDAAADAKVGNDNIGVTATPATGDPVSAQIPVKVTAP
jgi:hypothetical protein